MASRTLNPRFDHTCRIWAATGGDEMHDGEQEVIYEGKCYIYEANNLRNYTLSFGSTTANKEDMGCDIPGLHADIKIGMYIDYDRYGETAFGLQIATAIPSKMGTTVRFNRPKI